MDVEILDQDENPMLHRTDVRFQLIHDEATPSRLSVRDSLAAKLNKDSGEVVIQKLDTKYGMRKTVGYAKVYETADHASEVEQDHALARNKIAVGADGEAAPEGATDAESEPEPEAEAESEPEPEAEAESEPEPEAEAESEEA